MNGVVVERPANSTSVSPPVSIFCSYAHSDEYFRAELDKHLSVMRRNGEIAGWHDRKITAGLDWKRSIDNHLQKAEIILLLVSADFLASDFCYEIEMKQAMERHEAGNARVIPILLRGCDWSATPFSKLQVLPRDGRPIKNWPNPDEAYREIVAEIKEVAIQIKASRCLNATNKPVEQHRKKGRRSLLAVLAVLVALLAASATHFRNAQLAKRIRNQTQSSEVDPERTKQAAAFPTPLAEAETVIVSGFVTDTRERPIEGVSITLVELRTMAPVQTSSYGRFIIKGVPRKKGDWVDITATKEGYKPNHEKYLIGPAIEIRLERGR